MLKPRIELFLTLVLFAGLGPAPSALAQATTKAPASDQPVMTLLYDELRRDLVAAAGDGLELVKAEPLTASTSLGGTQYWLAFVRPKRVGHFAVKYTFKHHDKFYAEGEREFYLRAGGDDCRRYPQPFVGGANVCLGDTVILPIRLSNFSGHRFAVKYTPENPLVNPLPSPRFGLNEPQEAAEKVPNPLADKIKYLGTVRSEMLHRNGGATVVYSAVFQAVGTGQFNLEVSRDFGLSVAPTSGFVGGTAIIIQPPGTPATFLAPQEKTIDYTEGRTFSGHAANNFLISTRILQLGDLFSVEYGQEIHRVDPVKLRSAKESSSVKQVNPLIQAHPFTPSRDYYNAWIFPYLPN